MTAAVYRDTQSLSIPQTQNTAPVIEFNCLYTHDVRRKAKRWQDGFLRYHTFNKRIMVYDVPRNFIGDVHWTAGELQDGDELTLDKAGVLVQVAEVVGRTETDLTEVKKSKTKGSSERGSSPPPLARAPQTPAVRGQGSTAARAAPTQLKHRSLNALLGTPKGLIGKATLPTKSPFELRHGGAENRENEGWEQGRPPKRQRVIVPGAAVTPKRATESPLWARTTDAVQQKKHLFQAREGESHRNEVIDLCDQEPRPPKPISGFPSDRSMLPTSPDRGRRTAITSPPVQSSSPAFQTQEPSDARERGFAQRAMAVSPSRRIKKRSEVSRENENASAPAGQKVPAHPTFEAVRASVEGPTVQKRSSAHEDASQSPSKRRALRLPSSAPKRKLLCQGQLFTEPKRTDTAISEKELGGSETAKRPKTQRQLLEERLLRVKNKHAKAQRRSPHAVDENHVQTGGDRANANTGLENVHDPVKNPQIYAAEEQQRTSIETSARHLSRLDSKILPEKSAGNLNEEQDTLVDVQIRSTGNPSKLHADLSLHRGQTDAREDSSTAQAEQPLDILEEKDEPCPKTKQPPAHQGLEEPVPQRKPPMPVSEVANAFEQTSTILSADHALKNAAEIEPMPKDDRQLNSAASDANSAPAGQPRRTPGAPMKFTTSPSKPQPPTPRKPPTPDTSDALIDAAAQPPPPPPPSQPKEKFARRPRKQPQQAVSLRTSARGTAAVMIGRPFHLPKPAIAKEAAGTAETTEAEDVVAPVAANPWSREAFDLFDWRPPNWDEENWCFKDMAQTVDGAMVERKSTA